MEVSPRATVAYLHWLSMRKGSPVMPSRAAIRADCSWFEWPDSTDSQKRASDVFSTAATRMGSPGPSLHRGKTLAPLPRVAAKSAPVSLPAAASGRFGQPRAAQLMA